MKYANVKYRNKPYTNLGGNYMRLKRACLTFTTLILILFSTSLIIPVPAQEKPPEEPPKEPPWWKEEGFNGTLIFWDKEQESLEDSWSWLSQAWEFGPYPTFRIYLQNGTEVNDTNCIPLGELFTVVIDIKKTIFTGNMTLGRAGLNWHADLRSENGTEIGFADCRMVYVNEITTQYWNESDIWHIESFLQNNTKTMPPPEEGPPPPPEEYEQISFYTFYEECARANLQGST